MSGNIEASAHHRGLGGAADAPALAFIDTDDPEVGLTNYLTGVSEAARKRAHSPPTGKEVRERGRNAKGGRYRLLSSLREPSWRAERAGGALPFVY